MDQSISMDQMDQSMFLLTRPSLYLSEISLQKNSNQVNPLHNSLFIAIYLPNLDRKNKFGSKLGLFWVYFVGFFSNPTPTKLEMLN